VLEPEELFFLKQSTGALDEAFRQSAACWEEEMESCAARSRQRFCAFVENNSLGFVANELDDWLSTFRQDDKASKRAANVLTVIHPK
jgi:hypothetical protein